MAEQSIAEVVAQAREDAEAANNRALRDETSVLVVPDGWQLVPKEPSWEVLIDHGLDSDTWAALLAALPTPPAAEAVGGGPAASTASDDLVTEIAEVIRPLVREYAIEGAYPNPPAIARAVLSSPPVREIVEALNDALGMFKCTQRIDSYQPDHWSRRARSILSRFQSVGGEKHDHADGTQPE